MFVEPDLFLSLSNILSDMSFMINILFDMSFMINVLGDMSFMINVLGEMYSMINILFGFFVFLCHFQQYFSCIMATSFSGGRSWRQPWASNW